MDHLLIRTIALLGVAMLVAITARRLRLPYTVGLVVAGIGLALTPLQSGAMLTHDLIFNVVLPPLLFEAALSLRWPALRRDLLPIFTLSTLGVLISMAVVSAGMVALLGWPLYPALVFGTLIAATDPIAVIAMFKDSGIHGRLRLLVESESLFNDGVAAVLFALLLAWLPGEGALSASAAASMLALMAGGGILLGLACGALAIVLAGRTSDHLVETTLTVVAAYGSFLLAEYLHCSGVLACVGAGLLMGNADGLSQQLASSASSDGRRFVVAFWDFAAFIANSLVFLLIGLAVGGVPFAALGMAALATVIALVLAARALSVYPLALLFRRSRWALPLREQHVLWWGGLRGALALALALALPPTLAQRSEILIAVFGVVAFSVVLQGLTMPPLLRALKLVPARAAHGQDPG